MNENTDICRHCNRVIVRVTYVDGSAYWLHQDGVPIASGGGYSHCRTGTTAGPPNPGTKYSPSKELQAIGNAMMDAVREAIENPVLRALSQPSIEAPPCFDHVERQHRDMQPPWCNSCGWTHGREAIPVMKLGKTRTEREAERMVAEDERSAGG